MHSTSQYTEGLNIRYLPPGRRFAFLGMIRMLLNTSGGKLKYNGKIIYEIIKRHYPDFAKIAYRKYFTTYLTGTVVNEGLNPVTPLMELYIKVRNFFTAKSTSNYLDTKAKQDTVISREVNRALYDRRSKNMLVGEQKAYQPGGTGGQPPGVVTPGQVPPNRVRGGYTPGGGRGTIPTIPTQPGNK